MLSSYYITLLAVRSGLKGFLMKLSLEAKEEMKCFILKTVVHKVCLVVCCIANIISNGIIIVPLRLSMVIK